MEMRPVMRECRNEYSEFWWNGWVVGFVSAGAAAIGVQGLAWLTGALRGFLGL